jgi:hypothetical protein
MYVTAMPAIAKSAMAQNHSNKGKKQHWVAVANGMLV